MSDTPLISVIIPVYNGETYIVECIESILNQSYRNVEIIVIDDGSTDNTVKLVHRFNDSRIRVLSQANGGPSRARNLGLENASGEYVTFVDADDYIAPECIEVLYMLMSETGADISAAGFTRKAERLGLFNERYYTLDARGYLSDVLYQRGSDNSVWGKLYKTSLWDDVKFRDMRYEDLEVFPRVCLKANSVTVTEAKLYFYRPNPDSFISVFSNSRLDALKAVDLIMRHVEETNCHDELVRAARSRKLAASFNIFLLTAGKPEFDDVANRSWSNIRQLRSSCLTDSNVKLKIKLGILASMTGRNSLRLLNSLFAVSS